MNYNVQSDTGDSIRVPATNWLIALGNAAELLDINVSRCAEWKISRQSTGVVVIEDEGVKGRWTITEERPDIRISISGRLAVPEEDVDDAPFESPTLPFQAATTPMLKMPRRSSLHKSSDAEYIETVFELTGDIAGKSPEVAASEALKLAMSISEADSGSVVRGTVNDQQFTYFWTAGALAEALDGHVAAFGVGLIGMCQNSSMTIEVHNVNAERTAHLPEALTPQIKSMVCVPIIDDKGRVYGVIELINVPASLGQQKLDAIESIGKTLGGTLAAR